MLFQRSASGESIDDEGQQEGGNRKSPASRRDTGKNAAAPSGSTSEGTEDERQEGQAPPAFQATVEEPSNSDDEIPSPSTLVKSSYSRLSSVFDDEAFMSDGSTRSSGSGSWLFRSSSTEFRVEANRKRRNKIRAAEQEQNKQIKKQMKLMQTRTRELKSKFQKKVSKLALEMSEFEKHKDKEVEKSAQQFAAEVAKAETQWKAQMNSIGKKSDILRSKEHKQREKHKTVRQSGRVKEEKEVVAEEKKKHKFELQRIGSDRSKDMRRLQKDALDILIKEQMAGREKYIVEIEEELIQMKLKSDENIDIMSAEQELIIHHERASLKRRIHDQQTTLQIGSLDAVHELTMKNKIAEHAANVANQVELEKLEADSTRTAMDQQLAMMQKRQKLDMVELIPKMKKQLINTNTLKKQQLGKEEKAKLGHLKKEAKSALSKKEYAQAQKALKNQEADSLNTKYEALDQELDESIKVLLAEEEARHILEDTTLRNQYSEEIEILHKMQRTRMERMCKLHETELATLKESLSTERAALVAKCDADLDALAAQLAEEEEPIQRRITDDQASANGPE